MTSTRLHGLPIVYVPWISSPTIFPESAVHPTVQACASELTRPVKLAPSKAVISNSNRPPDRDDDQSPTQVPMIFFRIGSGALCLGEGDLSNQCKNSEAHESFHGISLSPLNTNERHSDEP